MGMQISIGRTEDSTTSDIERFGAMRTLLTKAVANRGSSLGTHVKSSSRKWMPFGRNSNQCARYYSPHLRSVGVPVNAGAFEGWAAARNSSEPSPLSVNSAL